MNRILCSTGAIGYYPVNPDADHMLNLFPQLNADGYEVIIDRAVPDHAEAWSARLREAGVPVDIVHIGKQTGECFSSDDTGMHQAGLAKLEADLVITRLFGASRAVLHAWGWPGNDRNFNLTLRSLEAGLALAERAGVELLVETIPCVVRPLIDRMQELADRFPGLRFTLDSRLLALQNDIAPVLSAAWLWDECRVAHVHVSDCGYDDSLRLAQRPILQPGDGVIDLDGFFWPLRDRGYVGALTLEAPAVDPVTRIVDVDVLNRGLDTVRTSMQPRHPDRNLV